jgi:hypothetical protein
MASAVNFRMHHGSESSSVNFVGNGIRVLDLKREILERKKFSGSSDFDLKIVDESGKGPHAYFFNCHFALFSLLFLFLFFHITLNKEISFNGHQSNLIFECS